MQEIYSQLKEQEGLKIGIIDADLVDHGTRHPNLALLKISSYCKACGHSVELLLDYAGVEEYDYVFLSCVFSFTKVYEEVIDLPYVFSGGTGLYPDGGEDLPPEVEHCKPDYSLYEPYVEAQLAKGRRRSALADYIDYSIGFTTRGCFRKCSFCVNKKYSRVQPHSPVQEFLDEDRPYIYLWDDNFLAFSDWKRVLEELQATGKPFQFRQGLDVRLMTNEKAKALSRCRYHGDFIFAFDHLQDRELIEKKLRLWRTWTDKGTRLYVLSGYDSQDEKDIESVFERIAILMKYDCLPYIMRYESYKSSRWRSLYVNIARWCNQPQFFKKKSFREFCVTNQEYHKNKETMCSAYKSMTDFEREFPEIASRYFDLKFEEVSMMKRYGRRYFGAMAPEEQALQERCWKSFASGTMNESEVLSAYFSKKLDSVYGQSLEEENVIGGGHVEKLFRIVSEASLEDIYSAVLSIGQREIIAPLNVPQFSKLESAFEVPVVLLGLGEPQTFDGMGVYLDYSLKKKPAANKKYGENHSKLATLLDLADIVSVGNSKQVAPAPFGTYFSSLDKESRERAAARLAFRIPVVQHVLADALDGEVSIADYLKPFAETTKMRRLPNVVAILDLIKRQSTSSDSELRYALKNVRR